MTRVPFCFIYIYIYFWFIVHLLLAAYALVNLYMINGCFSQFYSVISLLPIWAGNILSRLLTGSYNPNSLTYQTEEGKPTAFSRITNGNSANQHFISFIVANNIKLDVYYVIVYLSLHFYSSPDLFKTFYHKKDVIRFFASCKCCMSSFRSNCILNADIIDKTH